MKFLHVKNDQGVVRWHIDRPERMNALGTTLAKELHEASQHLRVALSGKKKSKTVTLPRCLVISAATQQRANQKIWIAGGDLKELAVLKNATAAKAYAGRLADLCFFLEGLPIPVIAIIDGLAIGGGAELALAADLRLGTESAGFHFKQLDVGLATGYGGAKRLVDLVGRALAQKLLYARDLLDADAAYAAGLLTHLCGSSELEAAETQILEWIASLHIPAFTAQKTMLRKATTADKKTYATAELSQFLPLWRNDAHTKFLERFDAPRS